MRHLQHNPSIAGISFVEVLIVVALIGLIFGGLLAGVQTTVRMIGNSKAKAGANALLVERMEFIRSLPYDAVGTIGAPPYGDIAQTSTTSLNGVSYTEDVLIRYVDDPADGLGYTNDANGIIEDYKQVAVTYSWHTPRGTSSVASVTNIVPVGIESSTGGGSLRVNVFDADATPLSGVSVSVVNDTLATTTNTTQLTDAGGQLLISGLPEGANYEIWATQSGYSGDGTYVATTSNPNPTTPPVAIVASAVSTMNFQIDQLSDLAIEVLDTPTTVTFFDTFTDDASVYTYASTTRTSGAIELTHESGTYASSGTLLSASTSPSTIDAWSALDLAASTSSSTEVRVHVYYDDGSGSALVPDADLAGNSTGFTAGPVDLGELDTNTYDTLLLGGTLTTSDTNTTPRLHEWSLSYIEQQSGFPGVPVDVVGSKVIGTNASGTPIYKFDKSYTSDGNGEVPLTDIEYDTYRIMTGGGYDVLEVCPLSPLALLPNASEEISLTVDALSGAFLRVTVTDSVDGTPIPGASVRLQNDSYDRTQETSVCGQTYFNGNGLYSDDDYTMTVSASGYDTEIHSSTTISTTASTTVSLTSS